jgi:hypothetical protein
VRPGAALAAIVVGLVLLPVIAFAVAKSRPQHGSPPPPQPHSQPAKQTAPAVSI